MSTSIEITEQLERDWGEIVLSIVDEAREIFRECGDEDDFGLQHAAEFAGLAGVIVFGGTNNRLLWSPGGGFRPDASYCSSRFLERFNAALHGGN